MVYVSLTSTNFLVKLYIRHNGTESSFKKSSYLPCLYISLSKLLFF